MELVPVDPRPVTDERGRRWENAQIEQCPVCGQWLKPLPNGRVRRHRRYPTGLYKRCPGSGALDERVFVVVGNEDVRLHVTGRRTAELLTGHYPGATIWQEIQS